MKHLSLIAFLLFTSLSFAQSSFNSDSFIVGRNDIETTTFETDSTANALVIYEYGNSYIDKDSYTLKTEIKRKIKILALKVRQKKYISTKTIGVKKR